MRWSSSVLRFSLRRFLLVMMLFAGAIALSSSRAAKQRRAVEALVPYGHVVYEHEMVSDPAQWPASIKAMGYGVGGTWIDYGRETPGPKWLRRLVGDDYFRRVVLVSGAAHSDLLKQLPNLRGVEDLSLDGYYMSDSDLAVLKAMPRLRELTINGAPELTDKGVEYLAKLPLHKLRIRNAPITDRSVDAIAKMLSLKQLELWNTAITETGEAALTKKLPNTSVTMALGYEPPSIPNTASGRAATNDEVRPKKQN